MLYPEIPLAQSVLQILKSKGIKDIIISPGSRNAPLTIGFASDPFFSCYSIVDERCAAFFGLGIAQQTRKPIALLCTSGSALLNYYPAFSEAFYSQIPMIVLSADRPTEKIDIGDGQTIRQQNVFSNHSLFNANLTEDTSHKNDHLICEAIDICITQQGPVHINIPFEEPLYNTSNKTTYKPDIKSFNKEKKDIIDFIYCKETWQKSTKKMILIGAQTPKVLSEEITNLLARDPSAIVLTEVNSNVHHPYFVSHIDALITHFSEEEFIMLQPELLITIGGMVVSKRIKSFLRTYKAQEHWHIDLLRAYDTFQSLTAHIKSTAEMFFERMYESDSYTKSNYQSQIIEKRKILSRKQIAYLHQAPYSDLKVYEMIWNHLPKNSQIQISNSAAIRYAQLFPSDPESTYYCNRGTSGIDGSTSTAIGASISQNQNTILITGDISFYYDSNALWNNYIPKNFKIIIINNSGGGIFRILPGHKENQIFHQYFETQHQLNARNLAEMYQFDYLECSNLEDCKQKLTRLFQENDKPAILEIFTPTNINQDILRNYF